MNRAERRRKERQQGKKLKKVERAAHTLPPSKIELVDILAEQKTDKLLDAFREFITTSMIKSMRKNKISLQRVNRIIEQANEIMEEEMKNGL